MGLYRLSDSRQENSLEIDNYTVKLVLRGTSESRDNQAVFRIDVNAAKNIRELAVCGGALREWAKARADANLQRT